MEKYKAIPEGFMTIGEFAKKMGVTVRTLQHYDRISLLMPSAESDGGRRLYSDKDLIKLHQILSLKHLGFTLEDIKSRLLPLESSNEVAQILAEQAEEIKRKIEALSASLREIEMLKAEVLQINKVDFKKYADIIINLQMKNEFYGLIKHFDDQTLDVIRSRFNKESGNAFMVEFLELNKEILQLEKNGNAPQSEKTQATAKRFWDLIIEFTNGDLSMLPTLIKMGQFSDDGELTQKLAVTNDYMSQALDIYFTNMGVNPLEGGT